jgi:hypothetical protein
VAEFLYCLEFNRRRFDCVFVLSELGSWYDDLRHEVPGVIRILQEGRPSYDRMIHLLDERDALVYLANSDITIENPKDALAWDWRYKFACIGKRNDDESEPCWPHGSQDAWAFRSPLVGATGKPFHPPADLRMGEHGCELRLAWEANQQLNIFNPCQRIICRHWHVSGLRTRPWPDTAPCPQPALYVYPGMVPIVERVPGPGMVPVPPVPESAVPGQAKAIAAAASKKLEASRAAHDGTSITPDGDFAAALRAVVMERKPAKIIECGTYHGTGTTAVICRALRAAMWPADFYSIEASPANVEIARKNLADAGRHCNVTPGLSVPRSMLPSEEFIAAWLKAKPEGVKRDYPECGVTEAADHYRKEIGDPNVPDDALGRIMANLRGCDLAVLDSGGGMGLVEFVYLISLLDHPCVIALDDTRHVKHWLSRQWMRKDARFEVIAEGTERHGWVVAEFTP